MLWIDAQALLMQGQFITSPRLQPDEQLGLSPNGQIMLYSPRGNLDGWRPSQSDQMADTWFLATS